MTIYRTTMRQALEEMYQNLNEDNLDLMRKAAGGAKQTLKMKDGKIGVDSFTASAIMQIYDKINDKNKKTFENMMKNGKKADIMKLQKFAMSKVNASYEEFEEEVELDEAKYDLYHKDFSSAMQHAYKMAKKLHGITVDPKEIDDKVASGPRKPSEGKTNTYRLKGDKGAIQVQVYNKGGSKPFELNFYKEEVEVELDEGKMSQLHQYIKDKKSPEEIAKLMKLDVKTIKALMNSHHPEEVEESKTTVPMSTKAGQSVKKGQVPKGMYGNAARDARRAMGRDPEMRQRPFSKDDSATDDDVKGASKNIMMQMRKAQSLNGRFDVEFADGKKVKIPAKMAIAVQQKYNKMRRPAEKEKFQAKVGKSYRDMLSALKEAVSPAQQAAIAISKKERGEKPKKESVLDRIDKKIKEKNDG